MRDRMGEIDAVRYYIHGRLILPAEKLPAAIYHDRSYEAVRVITAVAEKKKQDCRVSMEVIQSEKIEFRGA